LVLDINKLFDDVFVHKIPLEFWEREQVINQIMRVRDLIGAKKNVREDEYHTGNDETIVFILEQLMEMYALKFFSTKSIEKRKKADESGETWFDIS
jgi:hypothetical protein